MRKFLFVATLTSILGSAAIGDLIALNVTQISNNDDAKNVYNKIIEVTGAKPSTYRGRSVVGADANVTCYKSLSSEQYYCHIGISKPKSQN